MIFIKPRILVLVITLLSVQQAEAKSAKQQPSGVSYRYGMGGCGPGSVLFSSPWAHNSIFAQILASITNNNLSAGSYTSAVVSGTSNCSNDPASEETARRSERDAYVSMNLNELVRQASQGDGVHLRGLAELMGCGGDVQFELFAAVAQEEHQVIFSDQIGSSVSERLMQKLRETGTLDYCSRSK